MSCQIREVIDEARREGCLLKIEESFRKEYLEQIVSKSDGKSANDVLAMLLASIGVYETLHEYEDKMNRDDFAKRMCSGWEISGTDKEGRPVLWVRIGMITAGFDGIAGNRSLRPGTQEWYSAIRSTIYVYELFTRSRILTVTVPEGFVVCFDCRGQGMLDGNFKFASVVRTLMQKLFPEGPAERFYMFGINRAVSVFASDVCKVWAGHSKFVIMPRPEDASKFMADERDIPDWLLNYTPYPDKCLATNQVWGLDRFMDDDAGNRVRHADIFNPSRLDSLEDSAWLPLYSGRRPSRTSLLDEILTGNSMEGAPTYSIKPINNDELRMLKKRNSLAKITEDDGGDENIFD